MVKYKEQITDKAKGLPPMMKRGSLGGGIVPQTDFGRELLALRNKAIDNGMKLRGAEEILSEIEESRRPLYCLRVAPILTPMSSFLPSIWMTVTSGHRKHLIFWKILVG